MELGLQQILWISPTCVLRGGIVFFLSCLFLSLSPSYSSYSLCSINSDGETLVDAAGGYFISYISTTNTFTMDLRSSPRTLSVAWIRANDATITYSGSVQGGQVDPPLLSSYPVLSRHSPLLPSAHTFLSGC